MKHTQLSVAYVPGSKDSVRRSLLAGNEGEPAPVIDGSDPDARRLTAEGAICLIPAANGCVVVTGQKPGRLRSWLSRRPLWRKGWRAALARS